MKVGYLDATLRRPSERINYTDLIIYRPGFVWLDTGDVLLMLQPDGADRWIIEGRFPVDHAEEGGDSLDLYLSGALSGGAEKLERGDPRLAGWWPEPVVYPRLVPADVAARLGFSPAC